MNAADSRQLREEFFRAVARASARALLLDYDGTLAPFRSDRLRAFPYRGIPEALRRIVAAGRGTSRVAVVSGRPVRDLPGLLRMDEPPELWGSHGLERLSPDGTYDAVPPAPALAALLREAEEWIEGRGWSGLLERKPYGLALHARGAAPKTLAAAREAALLRFGERAVQAGLEVLEFDGGVELRPAGSHKGNVVRRIARELGRGAAIAYLGDDRARRQPGSGSDPPRNSWSSSRAGKTACAADRVSDDSGPTQLHPVPAAAHERHRDLGQRGRLDRTFPRPRRAPSRYRSTRADSKGPRDRRRSPRRCAACGRRNRIERSSSASTGSTTPRGFPRSSRHFGTSSSAFRSGGAERVVGQINGQYTRSGWVPIHYIYRSLDGRRLPAYYLAADVALVTPLKDGMNLVAKEYCASRIREDGVPVLSKFAGAAAQLHRGALLVNPYDVEGVACALERAVTLPASEQQSRMRRLRCSVREHDIFWWLDSFLRASIARKLGDFPRVDDYLPEALPR